MPSTRFADPPSHSGKQIVIDIKVTITEFGVSYHSFFFFSGQSADAPVHVRVGDQVAWYVEVTSTTVPTTPPYQLTFSDDNLFGVSSLSVPKGGGSIFLTVLPHVTSIITKYTVAVDGIRPTYDPEIQTDTSGSLDKGGKNPQPDFVASNYVVSWRPDAAPDTLTCTKNGAAQPFPLTVFAGDHFTFNATGAAAPPDFSVYFFSDGTSWASPFDLNQSKFDGATTNGNNSSTGQKTVGAIPKLPHAYTFLDATNDLSIKSNPYTIKVAATPAPAPKDE